MTAQEIEESRLQAQSRYEAFLAETKRLERENRYWESRARNDLKNICFLYQCDCGKLVGVKHALNCPDRDLTPVMLSEVPLSDRLNRLDDPFNDYKWDYDADVEKLAEVLT
tara:strand:- start:85 stop:417 length:333 start_codon:yes stop_codon:yes gene_type:complete